MVSVLSLTTLRHLIRDQSAMRMEFVVENAESNGLQTAGIQKYIASALNVEKSLVAIEKPHVVHDHDRHGLHFEIYLFLERTERARCQSILERKVRDGAFAEILRKNWGQKCYPRINHLHFEWTHSEVEMRNMVHIEVDSKIPSAVRAQMPLKPVVVDREYGFTAVTAAEASSSEDGSSEDMFTKRADDEATEGKTAAF